MQRPPARARPPALIYVSHTLIVLLSGNTGRILVSPLSLFWLLAKLHRGFWRYLYLPSMLPFPSQITVSCHVPLACEVRRNLGRHSHSLAPLLREADTIQECLFPLMVTSPQQRRYLLITLNFEYRKGSNLSIRLNLVYVCSPQLQPCWCQPTWLSEWIPFTAAEELSLHQPGREEAGGGGGGLIL